MEKKKLFGEISLMNALLCIGVIVIHLTSFPVTSMDKSGVSYLLIYILNRFFVFCVPSFIFLSGLKLHNKYRGGINALSFYKNRTVKILVPYVFAVSVYFLYFLSKQWVFLNEYPLHLVLGTISAHFYYVVISCQFYILFPLIIKIFEKYPGLILILSLVSTVIFQQFVHFPYSDRFFGSYVFYFVLGMYFSRNQVYGKLKKLSIPVYILSFVVCVIHISMLYFASRGIVFYRWGEIVNIIYVTLSAFALYGLCGFFAKFPVVNKVSSAISSNSYNIYLYHCLGISILKYDIFPPFNLSLGREFLFMSAVIFGGAALYCFYKYKSSDKSLQEKV
ncbi:MAG: acyltransferase [Clostridia bacterium]|nr:acyltransferase [Clostridia bacterium]